jgi:hypothetical protein
MRARTIGQIAALMMAHLGGGTPPTVTPPPIATPKNAVEANGVAEEIDFDVLSDKEIDGLIDGHRGDPLLEATSHV